MAIGDKNNKTARPPSDFDLQLTRQLGYLRRSCASYDAGDHDEAVRIALALRVLLHQTPQSTSLLSHLGIQDTLSYVDTGVYRSRLLPALQAHFALTAPGMIVAGTSASDVGLVETGDAGSGRIGWYAPLRLRRFMKGSPYDSAVPGASAFAQWWNDPLVESTNGKSFSRKNLVLIMANQDGGGHVDAALDSDYADLTIDPLGSAVLYDGVKDRDLADDVPDIMHNVAFASVRQIGFELIVTMDRYSHIQRNPGALSEVDPFRDLPIPSPPHRTVISPIITMVGTPANK